MAVDTQQKRGSSIGIAGPPVLPAADSTIDADDRRMTALSYGSALETFVTDGPYFVAAVDQHHARPVAHDQHAAGAVASEQEPDC